ncbi:unnamed protein product [Thelazia callipaeda]|uniref:UBX domain-containing protein 4 n=1 Tax=Thelazia callipaeda TaxID=103827 RepID=A0A0N5D1P7_THECL|nr:unnamed protein product [Thelazia callipaeda]
MKWFEGNITEAIAQSHEQRIPFVVMIQHPFESHDEQSIRMSRLWEKVGNNICLSSLIGIRIFSGTETARQFTQIYPVSVVPSCYIIDLNGRPIEVITNSNELDENTLLQKLKTAYKDFIPEHSSLFLPVADQSHKKENQEDQSAGFMEDDMKRYLLFSMSCERQKRIEIAKQRKRHECEEAYLKKLREQIKADKMERMEARLFSTSKQKCEAEPTKHQTGIPNRFSDGSTLVHNFASSDTFSQLVELVEKDGRGGSDFYLVQMYPRREISDFTQTFSELGLIPSATMLVVSKRHQIVANYNGLKWINFIHYAVIAPFQALYRIILYIVGYNNSPEEFSLRSSINTTKNSVHISRKDGQQQTNHIRQNGGIHRFRNKEDSSNSDDEGKWNGNSTQQL